MDCQDIIRLVGTWLRYTWAMMLLFGLLKFCWQVWLLHHYYTHIISGLWSGGRWDCRGYRVHKQHKTIPFRRHNAKMLGSWCNHGQMMSSHFAYSPNTSGFRSSRRLFSSGYIILYDCRYLVFSPTARSVNVSCSQVVAPKSPRVRAHGVWLPPAIWLIWWCVFFSPVRECPET